MTRPAKILLRAKRFYVEEVEEPLRGGGTSPRHVVRHPGAVAIIPVLDDGRICLIRNRRVSVDRELIEIPAGTLEPGEDPKETAFRELREETGYRAGRMEPLHAFFLSPGILDERMHVFVATQLVFESTALEPGEFIENLIVSLSEALAMCRDGTIEDAKSLVGLMLYESLRKKSGS